ncbi:sigma 54-interacting transcriptional regulator, partial [Pseudomonas sp. GW460-13]
YEKGAFTGAMARKPGLVETAQQGTLFLDEIGDVPLTMQVKLLRLIESRTFRRVGGLETHSADFRLVAATHKPLQQMVAQGTFRQDLLYR